MIFHLPFLPNAPPTSPETAEALKQSSLLCQPPLPQILCLFTSVLGYWMPERPAMGSMGTEATRGTQQKWPFSSELRAVFGAAALPKDQSFTDFEFPPWHEHKTSEITLGSGGIRGWVKRVRVGGGVPQASMSCRFVLLARLQFHSEHH